MKIDNLPSTYIVPKHLNIGTNQLENVIALISFKEYIPILIGEGYIPKVWLNIPINKEGTEWYPLIKDNFSTNDKVVVLKDNRNIKITTPDGVILDAYSKDNGEIIINTLNLMQFGLDVKSNENELVVMNNTYIDNTFKNVRIMIGIGE